MKLYHQNPRQITTRQYSDLEKWLRQFGDLGGVVHDLNSDEIISANQRSRVFDINKCEIEITERLEHPDEQGTIARGWVIWEGKKYAYRQVRWTPEWCAQANIVANKAGGTWDMDMLANQFEQSDLLEWGFEEIELGITKDDLYTGKIVTPTYEPVTDTPESLDALVNRGKVEELLKHISQAEGVSDAEKDFLRIAAYRHYVFNFKAIANYYASANPAMQGLMEESALVIIDFNRAIELGYARLTAEISELMQAEYGDNGR